MAVKGFTVNPYKKFPTQTVEGARLGTRYC
jgi:hypothetical protein